MSADRGHAEQQMAGMPGMAHGDGCMTPAVWTPGYAGLIFAMWWIMMVAMMLPSAAPMLLLFARVNRKEKAGGRPYVPTGDFRGRISCGLGRVQRACRRPAVGTGAARLAVVR